MLMCNLAFFADKFLMSRVVIRLGRRFFYLILISIMTTFAVSAQTAASTSETKSRRDAFLAQIANLPSTQLLAMSRQARDENRFQDAILLLQTALNSPWGIKNFQKQLKESLAEANQIMNEEAPEKLERLMGVDPPKGDSFLLSLLEYEKNPTTQEERIRLELQSYLVKPLTDKVRILLLQRALSLVQSALSQRMPNNPLRYYESHQRYFIEGYFNSEYPGVTAETNLELGLLHKSLQDYVQAEHYLGEALAKRSYLPVPEREYEIRYALSEIYLVQGKLYQYEKSLLGLTALDRPFISQEGAAVRLRDQMRQVLLTDPIGLDKVLQLYRLKDDFSLEAHRLLGTIYLQNKDYEQALMHLIFAVIKPVSRAMEEIRARDYGYTFSTLENFLQESRAYPDIMRYLSDARLYEGLYNLAMAIPGYQPNNLNVPRRLWTLLAITPEAGPYQLVSAEKLKKLKH